MTPEVRKAKQRLDRAMFIHAAKNGPVDEMYAEVMVTSLTGMAEIFEHLTPEVGEHAHHQPAPNAIRVARSGSS